MRRHGALPDPVETAVERLRRLPGVTLVWWNCDGVGLAGVRRDGRTHVASAATVLQALEQLEGEFRTPGPPSPLVTLFGLAVDLLRRHPPAVTRPPAGAPAGRSNPVPPRSRA